MPQSVRSIIQIENRKTLASEIAEGVQRKVFATPPYTKRTVPELGELYQDEPALTKLEGVPEGP